MSSRVCLIIYDLPVYISSCLFSLMSSGLLVIPGVSCLWVLPCPVMSYLDVLLNIIIWVYILVCVFLFLPRVCTVTHGFPRERDAVSNARGTRYPCRQTCKSLPSVEKHSYGKRTGEPGVACKSLSRTWRMWGAQTTLQHCSTRKALEATIPKLSEPWLPKTRGDQRTRGYRRASWSTT